MSEEQREQNMDSWAEKLAARAAPKFQEPVPAPAPKLKTGNEKLAAQALELLVNLNDMICGGMMIVGFNATAMAISAREEAFREQALAALVADPELCKRLTEKAKFAGPLGLLLAYGMLSLSVAPVAVIEVRDLRERIAQKRGHA